MISLAKLLLDISSFELTMIECFTFWKIWDKKHIRVTLSIEIIGAQVSYSMKITLWIISASWRSDFGEEFIKFSGLIWNFDDEVLDQKLQEFNDHGTLKLLY